MACPKCGAEDVSEPACSRCGVIFAKVRSAAPRRPPIEAPATTDRSSFPTVALAGVAVAIVGAVWFAAARPARPKTTPLAPPAAQDAAETSAASLPPPDVPSLPPIVATPTASPSAEGLTLRDRDLAALLWQRVNAAGTLVAESDLSAVEDLARRFPAEPSFRTLREGFLVRLGVQEQSARRFSAAEAYFRQAAALNASSLQPRLGLASLFVRMEDWARAEAEARAAIAIEAASFEAWRLLGHALFRQDRNRDAAEALRTALAIRDDGDTRLLLARVQKGQHDEAGMTEQRLSHFNVRYDGDAHEDVGRAILRELERHHATLTSLFGRAPAATIPVVLFTEQGYYDANGAPAWSGGNFDGFDGRIRLPIGGLTSGLTPDMDDTLIHELCHAFVADASHGVAPHELQEGIAQYVEGKRLGSDLGTEQMKALSLGGEQSVWGFYVQALSFAEYLYGQRGQGGINDLLAAMAETGNVDAAFQRVYGKDFGGTRASWMARTQQLYGTR